MKQEANPFASLELYLAAAVLLLPHQGRLPNSSVMHQNYSSSPNPSLGLASK